jgi:hypothetical protein
MKDPGHGDGLALATGKHLPQNRRRLKITRASADTIVC